MKIAVAITLNLLSITVFAQKRDTVLLLPGNDLLETSNLTAYDAAYDFFRVTAGTETKVGGLDEQFTVLKKGSEKLGLRICKITFGSNNILDSGLCKLTGLKPIYHRSNQTAKILSVNFDGEKVAGFVTLLTGDQANKKEAILYQSSTPNFDSYYEDMIARTISKKKGLLFKFPEYIFERGGQVWSIGEVVGKEANGKDTAWTIRFYEKDNKGETVRTTTYRVSESTGKIVYREYLFGKNKITMRERA